jgi:hypothetical protein
MPDKSDDTGRRVADTIHGRVGTGPSDLVAGWQRMLADLLKKMAPYLTPGQLVTFHSLLPEEKTFFEALHRAIKLPAGVTALFISPSVRHQMMSGHPAGAEVGAARRSSSRSPDAGILLACRVGDTATIVNALFAHPPHTPAIDVYESGQLLAGYSYASMGACRGELSAVLQRHLA